MIPKFTKVRVPTVAGGLNERGRFCRQHLFQLPDFAQDLILLAENLLRQVGKAEKLLEVEVEAVINVLIVQVQDPCLLHPYF
jgi:hypothetical protein